MITTQKLPQASSFVRTLLLSATLLAASGGVTSAQTWIRDVEDTAFHAKGIAVRDDGMVAVVHNSGEHGGASVFDASGAKLSTYDLATFDGSKLSLGDAAFLDDGSLAVCGSAGARAWVAAINPLNGLPFWETTLTDDSSIAHLERMTVNNIGHVVCSGYILDPSDPVAPASLFVGGVKSDANGGTAYRRIFGTDASSSLTATASGDLVFASFGSTANFTRTTNWANIQWRKNHASVDRMIVPQIVETTDGSLCAVGVFEHSPNQYRFTATKMDALGDLIWRRNFDSFPSLTFGYYNETHSAAATPDGGVVVAVSQTMPGDGLRDAALLRLDADGNAKWLRPFGKLGLDDQAVEVAVTPDGGYVALAEFQGGGFRLVRFNSKGEAGDCSIHPTVISPLGVNPTNVTSETFNYENHNEFWGDVSTTPLAHAAAVIDVCGDSCVVTGSQYGAGTPGSGGFVPSLVATDGFCLGYTPKLEIRNAIGGAFGLLFIGFDSASIPLWGGAFLIDPSNYFTYTLNLDGAIGASGQGSATLPVGTDLVGLTGIALHMQAAFLDGSAQEGAALTNGVTFDIH